MAKVILKLCWLISCEQAGKFVDSLAMYQQYDTRTWQQVKQIFQSAIERPAPERDGFISQRSADDLVLRSQMAGRSNNGGVWPMRRPRRFQDRALCQFLDHEVNKLNRVGSQSVLAITFEDFASGLWQSYLDNARSNLRRRTCSIRC